MFTGIVQAIGEITAVARQGRDSRLTVAFRDLDCADVRIGDSIAMNGACMTVVALTPLSFQVDMSQESLQRTTRLDQIGPVNLEKAMAASDRFGGHLVSGHIDGVAPIGVALTVGSWIVERGSGEKVYFVKVNGVGKTEKQAREDGFKVQVDLIYIEKDGTFIVNGKVYGRPR